MKKLSGAILSLICALMSAALLGACSPSRSSEPNLSTAMPSAPGAPNQRVNFQGGGVTIRHDDSLTLPLDAYDSPQNWSLTNKAINALTQACMKRRGFDTPSRYFVTGRPYVAASTLYGVVDLASAEKYGYRSFVQSAAPSRLSKRPPQSISAATAKAFWGDLKSGHGGCRDEASEKLGMQKIDAAFEFVQELRIEARAAAAHDSRVQKVNANWSSCMKGAGYTYPSPTVPPHDRSLLGRGLSKPPGAALPPPSPAEKAAAVSDVKCKRRVNYLQTVALVTAAYQKIIIAQNASSLRQGQAAWQTVLGRADF
ncbi:hypothetical protein ACH41H_48620 [Streptomyces sp. NPDC020800]|uniref:hypothetical protein n=1 Tax=Streptomyces sp. NPDC020800 TaxID=3365092 RepID=UPI00379DFABB